MFTKHFLTYRCRKNAANTTLCEILWHFKGSAKMATKGAAIAVQKVAGPFLPRVLPFPPLPLSLRGQGLGAEGPGAARGPSSSLLAFL